MWAMAESKGRSWILQRGWVLLQGKWGASRAFKQDRDRIRGLLPVGGPEWRRETPSFLGLVLDFMGNRLSLRCHGPGDSS